MKISIIVISKGRLHHLKQTVESLVTQQLDGLADYEVLVVDYGCPDGTYAWCTQQNLPHLRSVRVDHDTMPLNKCRAKNFGARCTNADWLMFLDVDLIIPADLLRRSLSTCLENGSQWLRPAVRGNPVPLNPDNSRYWFPDAVEAGPPRGPDFVCVATFVAADLFRSVDGNDECLPGWGYEDVDLGLRLFRKVGGQHYLIPANFIFLNHSADDSVRFFENKNKAETASKNLERIQIHDRLINPQGYGQSELAAEWPESSPFRRDPERILRRTLVGNC
ncbi:MAG: exoU [Planctomycetaceae bacterium]|nr:exoU [Planctomycetaceae bacterium]